MSRTSRLHFLTEISQELARFQLDLQGLFRCPTCLCDFPIASAEVTEEHIIPESNGGKTTTFLCKKCNSTFGYQQTRWLSEYIDIGESNTPFHGDLKKQRVQLISDRVAINGSLKIAEDGVMDFCADRRRSNPIYFDSYWNDPYPSKITITSQMPLFNSENALRVGFLTAAYGLWFKHFGYSFVLQSSLDIVRQQIQYPDDDVISWNYLIEAATRELANPCIGLMRFGAEYFPIAIIYDTIVILPSSKRLHPSNTVSSKISKKAICISEQILSRYQHRCLGPAVLICDGQAIILPDLIANAAVAPQYIWLDGWP